MRPRNHLVVIFILFGVAVSAKSQPLAPFLNEPAQEAREKDRRFILETELHAEREALARSQAALSADATEENKAGLHRHVENVKALQRELERATGRRPQEQAHLTVRALVPSGISYAARTKSTSNFWDPYNRAPDNIDFSTTLGRQIP